LLTKNLKIIKPVYRGKIRIRMVSGFSGEDMCQHFYVPEAYIIYTIYILKSPFPLSPFQHLYTVKKKVCEFPIPSRDVTTKLSLDGNNDVITELFLPRGSLVSDIPAGDGKLMNLILQCTSWSHAHV
jgi:hypothetical protein